MAGRWQRLVSWLRGARVHSLLNRYNRASLSSPTSTSNLHAVRAVVIDAGSATVLVVQLLRTLSLACVAASVAGQILADDDVANRAWMRRRRSVDATASVKCDDCV